jgi:tetratricopeptide (TPR) repeat protein
LKSCVLLEEFKKEKESVVLASATPSLQNEARDALVAKDYPKAIAKYQQLIANNKVLLEQNIQRFKTSILPYHVLKQEKTALEHKQAIAYYGLGLAYCKLDKFNEAFPNLNEAVKLHPEFEKYQEKLTLCRAKIDPLVCFGF